MNTLALLLCSLTLSQSTDRTSLDLYDSVVRTLRSPIPTRPPANVGSTSVARLTHKVPKKAQEAFRRATALAQKQQHAEAVRELEQAVAIDPAFADAYNNLGVQHFLQQHFADAESALHRAIDLDPALATAHINLAYLALTKNDSTLAKQEAQRALALGDQDGEAQKVLDVVRAHPL